MPAAPGPILRPLRRNTQRAGLLRDLWGRHHPGSPLQAEPLTPHLQTTSGRGPLSGLRRGAPETSLLRNLWSRHHPLTPVQRRTGHPRPPGRSDPRLPGAGRAKMRPMRGTAAPDILRGLWHGHHAAARLPTRRGSACLPAGRDDAQKVLEVRRATARAPILRAVRRGPDSDPSVRGVNIGFVLSVNRRTIRSSRSEFADSFLIRGE
jgi:hypothetical protein